MSIGYSIVAVIQTRWGQALDPSAFPPENIIPFSKVRIIRNDFVYLESHESPLQLSHSSTTTFVIAKLTMKIDHSLRLQT